MTEPVVARKQALVAMDRAREALALRNGQVAIEALEQAIAHAETAGGGEQ